VKENIYLYHSEKGPFRKLCPYSLLVANLHRSDGLRGRRNLAYTTADRGDKKAGDKRARERGRLACRRAWPLEAGRDGNDGGRASPLACTRAWPEERRNRPRARRSQTREGRRRRAGRRSPYPPRWRPAKRPARGGGRSAGDWRRRWKRGRIMELRSLSLFLSHLLVGDVSASILTRNALFMALKSERRNACCTAQYRLPLQTGAPVFGRLG